MITVMTKDTPDGKGRVDLIFFEEVPSPETIGQLSALLTEAKDAIDKRSVHPPIGVAAKVGEC